LIMPPSKNTATTRTGYDPRKKGGESDDGNSVKFFKVEPGGFEDVTILCDPIDIISGEQVAIWLTDGNSPVWMYTGPHDPYHDLGVKPSDKKYKAFLPVLMSDGEQAIWAMSKTVHGSVLDIADATGRLKGVNLRIKRTGKGLQTRYSLVPLGTFTDVKRQPPVDVYSRLGPLTLEGVRELVADKLGYPNYDECLNAYQKENGLAVEEEEEVAPVKTKKAAAKKPKVEELSDLDVGEDDEE